MFFFFMTIHLLIFFLLYLLFTYFFNLLHTHTHTHTQRGYGCSEHRWRGLSHQRYVRRWLIIMINWVAQVTTESNFLPTASTTSSRTTTTATVHRLFVPAVPVVAERMSLHSTLCLYVNVNKKRREREIKKKKYIYASLYSWKN